MTVEPTYNITADFLPATRALFTLLRSRAYLKRQSNELFDRTHLARPQTRGLKYFVQEVKLGQKGTFYRLQIGEFESQVEAENFCVKFIAQTQKTRSDCIVVE